MRCKPGDLAVVVCDDDYPENIGKFVTVEERSQWEKPGEVLWCCTPHSPVRADLVDYDDKLVESGVLDMAMVDFPDVDLRPIRDPGEDARDETLDWLPSPTLETA